MTNKTASILDYQRSILSPDIWENEKILPDVKSFIYKALIAFFASTNIKGAKEFVSNLLIGSSLATYFYREDSDLDVKVVINVDSFKKYNKNYIDSTGEDICDELIEAGRKSHFLTSFIPNTTHPMDFYFFTEEEAVESSLIKYDSLYNLITDKWIKEPQKLEGKLSPSYVLNDAKDKAQKYIEKIVVDIEKAKRDSIDFLVLRDYMKTLDKDDLEALHVDFKTALDRINKDIEAINQDRQIVKMLRKTEFSKHDLDSDLEKLMGSINYSDGNLIYKILQRYGYLKILFEIYALYKGVYITANDVVNIYQILSGNNV
jgi:hypothetical protein